MGMAGKNELIAYDDASRSSPALTAQVKQEITREIVRHHLRFAQKHPEKTDLTNLQLVKSLVLEYLEGCERDGRTPTKEGIALSLGLTNRWLNKFQLAHPESPTSLFLEQVRELLGSIIQDSVNAGTAHPIQGIFVLKNLGLGYVDKLEVTPVETHDPLANLDSTEARKRLTEAIPDDD